MAAPPSQSCRAHPMLAGKHTVPCASAQTKILRRCTLSHLGPGLGERMNTIIAGRFNEQARAE